MTDQSHIHLEAMQVALDEARLAFAHGDVPVGAVVLHNGEVIARRTTNENLPTTQLLMQKYWHCAMQVRSLVAGV